MKRLAIGTLVTMALLTACGGSTPATSTTSTNSTPPASPPTTASLPDLEVNDIEETDDGAKITIHNAGTAPAGDFNLHIEISKDTKPAGEFNKKVNGLAAGVEKIIETSFSGTEHNGLIYTEIDSYNAIVESDEENNSFAL